MYKKFDKALYEENNQLAIDTVVSMLESRGNKVILPDREYYQSHDFKFISRNTGIHYKAEVERKKVWKKSGTWEGWKTVDIPHRKVHSKSDYFFMVNEPCDTILVCSMEDIKFSPVSEKNTIYTSGERFFNVPFEKFYLYQRRGEQWVIEIT